MQNVFKDVFVINVQSIKYVSILQSGVLALLICTLAVSVVTCYNS